MTTRSYCSTSDSKRSFPMNENLKSYPKSVGLTMTNFSMMSSTKSSTPHFPPKLTNFSRCGHYSYCYCYPILL
jgi:hypothetical protein